MRRVAAAGLVGLALTDHDTVDGVAAAAAEAEVLGLRFLPAAELSANEPGRSVHLLAFGLDTSDQELLGFLAAYRGDRVRRAREMVGRLERLGVPLTYADVEAEAGQAAPTRAHVARALVRTGHVRTIAEVFRRLLSRGMPAFVEKSPTPPAEVIERVHAAGGVVLVAHPGREHGEEELRRWTSEGLDGVELLHRENPPEVRRRLGALADELGWLRSGGSDWHGPHSHRAGIGSERVPESWLEEIAARCGSSTGA